MDSLKCFSDLKFSSLVIVSIEDMTFILHFRLSDLHTMHTNIQYYHRYITFVTDFNCRSRYEVCYEPNYKIRGGRESLSYENHKLKRTNWLNFEPVHNY